MRAAIVGCLLLASTTAFLPSANAEPSAKVGNSEARKLYDEATKLYNVRSFAEAAEKYKAASLVEPAPVLDYNLGQCYRQLGKYEDAIWHYQRYLDIGKMKPDKRAAVEQFIQQMRAELDRKAMSQPPTTIDTSGSEAASGKDGPSERLTVLRPVAPPREQGATAKVGARTGWFWLGVGLTSAGLVGGGATTWLALTADRMYSQSNETRRPSSERLDLADRADARRGGALVVGIASGVVLGVGVVTLAVAPRTSRPTNTVALTIGFTGNGVAMFGRF